MQVISTRHIKLPKLLLKIKEAFYCGA